MAVGESQAVLVPDVSLRLPEGLVRNIYDGTGRLYGFTGLTTITDSAKIGVYKQLPKCYVDYKNNCENTNNMTVAVVGMAVFGTGFCLILAAVEGTLIGAAVILGLCLALDVVSVKTVQAFRSSITKEAVKLANSFRKMDTKAQKESIGLIASVDKQSASMVSALLSGK